MKKFGNVFVEFKGKLTNINLLDQKHYEEFLEVMRQVQMTYYALMRGK